jgi:hypothetical protein
MTASNDVSKFETAMREKYYSPKVRKALSLTAFAGIVICVLVLLPPAQKIFFDFVGKVINIRAHSIEHYLDRLSSFLSLAVMGIVVLILLLCCLHSEKIAEALSDSKNDRTICGLGLGITFLGLIFVTVFSYRYGRYWLDSDHASEMILGELLAGENALASRQWYYSTELRLVYQTIFSMPLFKLFGGLNNWAFIRAAVIFLNNSLLVAAYIFMTRQMRIPNKWICLTAVFLLVPLSSEYWQIVTFGGYYIFFIAQNFCCLGLILRLAAPPEKNRHFRRYFILFGALSFILGMQGIRSLFNISIPLVLACFAAGRLNGIPKKKATVLLGIYSFVLCCAGFISYYLLRFIYSFQTYDDKPLDNLYEIFFSKLGRIVVSLFSFFGFSDGQRILSTQGVVSIVAIIFALCVLGYIIIFLAQNRAREGAPRKGGGKESDPRQFMMLYFLVSIVFNVFVFQIVEENVTLRYFFPFLILYVPLTAVLFERAEKTNSALSKTGLITAVFLFIFTRGMLNLQEAGDRENNSSRSGYIKYLSDNDLRFGFASFWNANVTTELTNGKIRLAGLKPGGLEHEEDFVLHYWLTPKAYCERSYYDGESFLLLTGDEWDMARQTGRPFSRNAPDYDDGEFVVLRYPSAAVIHDTILDKQ